MGTTQGARPETAIFKDRLIIERAAQTLDQTTSDESGVLFQRNAFTPSEGKICPLTECSHGFDCAGASRPRSRGNNRLVTKAAAALSFAAVFREVLT